MTPQDDDRDNPLAELQASAGGGTPDPDFLARLREESTSAFIAAGKPPITLAPSLRSLVATFLVRLSAAAVAAALLVAVELRAVRDGSEGPTPLVQALDRLADADGIHLRLTRGGQSSDVWVAKENRLRREESAE